MDIQLEIEIEYIKAGNDENVMDAATRIVKHEGVIPPGTITELWNIVVDRGSSLWSRIAAAYVLGFVDGEGVTEATIRPIACAIDEPIELRDYVEEALYHMAQRRRVKQHEQEHPDADSYRDQDFFEWRAEQQDLLPL